MLLQQTVGAKSSFKIIHIHFQQRIQVPNLEILYLISLFSGGGDSFPLILDTWTCWRYLSQLSLETQGCKGLTRSRNDGFVKIRCEVDKANVGLDSCGHLYALSTNICMPYQTHKWSLIRILISTIWSNGPWFVGIFFNAEVWFAAWRHGGVASASHGV